MEEDNKRDLIIEPWELLTIEQKIDLENELRKEIGIKGISNHPLAKFEYSAIAKDRQSDDVLFFLNEHDGKAHIVIHLTWSMDLEINNAYPHAEFYEDFYHFQYYRMYPDRNEWED